MSELLFLTHDLLFEAWTWGTCGRCWDCPLNGWQLFRPVLCCRSARTGAEARARVGDGVLVWLTTPPLHWGLCLPVPKRLLHGRWGRWSRHEFQPTLHLLRLLQSTVYHGRWQDPRKFLPHGHQPFFCLRRVNPDDEHVNNASSLVLFLSQDNPSNPNAIHYDVVCVCAFFASAMVDTMQFDTCKEFNGMVSGGNLGWRDALEDERRMIGELSSCCPSLLSEEAVFIFDRGCTHCTGRRLSYLLLKDCACWRERRLSYLFLGGCACSYWTILLSLFVGGCDRQWRKRPLTASLDSVFVVRGGDHCLCYWRLWSLPVVIGGYRRTCLWNILLVIIAFSFWKSLTAIFVRRLNLS